VCESPLENENRTIGVKHATTESEAPAGEGEQRKRRLVLLLLLLSTGAIVN